MDSKTLRRRHRKLQASKGSIFDPRTNLAAYQPPLGRRAAPSLEAHPSTLEAPGLDRFTGKGRLSPEGEWRAEDEGGGRRSPPEGDGRTEGPDRSVGGRGKDCSGGSGQDEGGCD